MAQSILDTIMQEALQNVEQHPLSQQPSWKDIVQNIRPSKQSNQFWKFKILALNFCPLCHLHSVAHCNNLIY